MENNENFVANAAENTEQTAEQTPKMFTQDEVNDIVGKSKARMRAKFEKENQKRYGDLEAVLKAGMGKEDIGEITDDLREFYGTKKGIKMPTKPNYTEQDIEVLARADADEIIRGGFEEVVDEVDRLTALGAANMTAREKAVFKVLAEHRQDAERGKELSKIGVTEDVYGSKDFKDFAGKFTANTPINEIYDLYSKTQPRKEHKTMGSMKNNESADSGVKDFYSVEEARKFTKKDFDNNPALFAAVERSMLKWK